MTNIELVRKVQQVIEDHSEEPADELVKLGEALIAIGRALKGQSRADAVAVINAVTSLL